MPLFDVFWSMLWFFLLVAWIWTVVVIIGDIFRSRDLGGFAKAAWVLFVVAIPWLGVLTYIVARGDRFMELAPPVVNPYGAREALKTDSAFYGRR